MIEVFKTNVIQHAHAKRLVMQIEKNFSGYSANFDLDDCDHILRVRAASGVVDAPAVILFLQEFDCCAEVLPDVEPLQTYISFLGKNQATGELRVGGFCMGKFI